MRTLFQATCMAALLVAGGGTQPESGVDLGQSIVMMQGNLCASILTHVRRGVYDSLTICQGRNDMLLRERLTVESNDGQNVVINRPRYGRYRGALSADRRTIRGTCDWDGCTSDYRWTGYIDWNWNDSPPLR